MHWSTRQTVFLVALALVWGARSVSSAAVRLGMRGISWLLIVSFTVVHVRGDWAAGDWTGVAGGIIASIATGWLCLVEIRRIRSGESCGV